MTKPIDPHIARTDLSFFGTVTASLSHEMMNVLATIGEYSGLLEDMSAASTPMAPERLQAVAQKITRQVGRGEELVRRLNRFAHRADETPRPVDLAELVTETTELCRRFAYLKQVNLVAEGSPPESGVLVREPFAGGQAIFLCIQLALSSADQARTVQVGWSIDGGEPRFRVSSGDPFDRSGVPGGPLGTLELVLAQLGWQMEWVSEPGKDAIVLVMGTAH